MAERIDDNVSRIREGETLRIICNHCSRVLAENDKDYMQALARYDGPVEMAGPQVSSEPQLYIDAEVTFRQFCCPGCFTAFSTQVVPANERQRSQ